MNIKKFKKGDIVVRTKPAKSLGPMMGLMGDVIERVGDRSYMGEKMKFIGVANGQIYLRKLDKVGINFIDDDDLRDLPIDLWDEGWEIWVDPLTLTGDEVYEEPKMTQAEYQAKIDIAIADEDYEEADRLKKKMEENK